MTTLLAASTATNAAATEGAVKTFLTNLRDYIADTLGTDSTNKGAIAGLLGSLLHGKVDKSGAYTVVAADRGKVINATGTWTLSLTAAATLGDGFTFAIRNVGTGAITIDPNLSEQIAGATTYVIGGGEFVIVYCDGAAFSFVGGSSAPAGTVSGFAGSAAPVGWLLCAGQAISRTTYSTLFAAIGTTYGAGDGSTTFNLPDLRGRVVAGKDNMGGTAASRLTSPVAGSTLGATGGAQSHTLSTAEMPSHTHSTNIQNDAGYINGYTVKDYSYGNGYAEIAVSTSSAGSGSAHNNVQPTLVLNYIIKT